MGGTELKIMFTPTYAKELGKEVEPRPAYKHPDMYASSMSLSSHQSTNFAAMSSGPLSKRICLGNGRCSLMRSSVLAF